MGIKHRLFYLLTINPNNSLMSSSSCFIPLGSFLIKMIKQVGKWILNGIYSRYVSFVNELLKHFSGFKLSASLQYLGFLPIAQALITILDLARISYPLIWHGCGLKVNFFDEELQVYQLVQLSL